MIKLKKVTEVCADAIAFKTPVPGCLLEISGLADLAIKNNFDYIEDGEGNWYSITVVKEKAPITDADAAADLAGRPRPDNPSDEATQDQECTEDCDESPEPIVHTVNSITKKLDQIIGNTLEINTKIEPQRADTLLKLAELKVIMQGTHQ